MIRAAAVTLAFTTLAGSGSSPVRPAPAAAQASQAAKAVQAVDTVAASAAVNAFRANCRAVGEALWGGSLCGPQVLVHAPTRAALASRPDPGGVFLPVIEMYAGRIPDDLPVANTAVEWGGDRWSMVLLPLPEDRRATYALLAHEAFHRAQPELGFELTDPASPHLDERDGRVWLRLELRALARALETTGEAATRSALDALLFRAYRHRLYPDADSLETALERNEGLAEYTGPAVGLLLDRYHAGWRQAVHERGLADLLAEALPGMALADSRETEAIATQVLARAEPYDHASVDAEEAERAARLAARLADIRSRLIDGPTLLLRQSNLRASFDPNTVVPVPGAGTYYPTGSFTAAWGRVDVREGGALVSPDWTALRLPAAGLQVDGDRVHGDGWTLELSEGWSLRERDTGWEVGTPED